MPTKPISHQQRTQIKKLASQGHTKSAISKLTGLGHGTIDKYVTLDQQRSHPLTVFRESLGELLNETLMSGMHLQQNLLISLQEEDIPSLSIAERKNLVSTLGTVNGIMFDKIRLHEGKSTSNTSHRIVLDQAHQARNWVESSKGKTPDITATSENPQ